MRLKPLDHPQPGTEETKRDEHRWALLMKYREGPLRCILWKVCEFVWICRIGPHPS